MFYIFYDSTVIATHEIIITSYILGNWAKESSRTLHKVTQVETGLYLILKSILLTITILKKLSHHQDHCAHSKDKHYLRRMVCLESRQEKHEHFRVVSPQPREGDSSRSWPEQSGPPGDTSLEWDRDAEAWGPCSHPSTHYLTAGSLTSSGYQSPRSILLKRKDTPTNKYSRSLGSYS